MDTRSTGEVVASLIVNAQAMLAKEVELARLELRRMVGRKVAAVVMLLLGALALVCVLLLAAVTAAIVLEDVLAERWMAWGVVTLGSALVALLLLVFAARTLSRGWSLGASRRAATTTGAWLRELVDELRGTSAPETTVDGASSGRTTAGGSR